VPAGESRLNVTANDVLGIGAVKVEIVDHPSVGRASVDGTEVILVVPEGHTDLIEFTYRVTAEGESSVATVSVATRQRDLNRVELAFIDSEDQTDEASPASGVDQVLQVLSQPPTLWLSLAELRLPLLPMTSALSATGVVLLLAARRARKRGFVAVRGVRRTGGLDTSRGLPFVYRHDAGRIWRTGGTRRRKGLVEIETPRGNAWVQAADLSAEQ